MTRRERTFDVFLSYNALDRDVVERIAQDLDRLDVHVFLDRWYLVPGRPWQSALENLLGSCGSAAILIGPHGLGNWQQREAQLALDRQARDPSFPVVPVLLPGSQPALGFLSLNTWVDLRGGLHADLTNSLSLAIRGQAPSPAAGADVRALRASICPYRGLRPFREEDAPLFHGRETFVDRLYEAVSRRAMVALVGPSGTGKSSVVQAGLLPRLRRDATRTTWERACIVPTDRPLHALAAAFVPFLQPELSETDRLIEVAKLAEHLYPDCKERVRLRDLVARLLALQPGTDRMLLVVDQWEELYTLCRQADTRAAFIDELLDATAAAALSVVLTVRGDFFGRLLESRALVDRLQSGVVQLGPMDDAELRHAIGEPAHSVGLAFEPGLVERLVEATGSEPGALPLLEHVLEGLWERRQSGVLSHDAYRDLGELDGAIARRAEAVVVRFSPSEERLIRRVFLDLARPGDETEDTRIRATLADLPEQARSLVRQLADARLLVTARDEAMGVETVEVAHEALLRRWPRLRGWLDEDREFRLWRQRLSVRATEWHDRGGDRGALLRSGLLAEAQSWLGKRGEDFAPLQRQYVETSLRSARRAKTMRIALLAATILVLGTLAAAFWRTAQEEARLVRRERRTLAARYEETGRRELLDGHPLQAAAYLSESYSLGNDGSSLRFLLRRAMDPLDRQLVSMTTGSRAVAAVEFSPGGDRVLLATVGGGAQVWDANTGQPSFALPPGFLRFSEDWSRFLTSVGDTTTVWAWDTNRQRAIFARTGSRPAFDASGERIVTCDGTTATVWNVDDGRSLLPLDHKAEIEFARFSPTGKFIATAGKDGIVRVWHGERGDLLRTLDVGASGVGLVAFSRDDSRVATTGHLDRTAKVWDTATGDRVSWISGHDDYVYGAEFSPDGTLLLTVGGDARARVWRVADGHMLSFERPPGQRELTPYGLARATFSPDGARVATALGFTEAPRIWDVETGAEFLSLAGHAGQVITIAFSPDGSRLASGSEDGTAKIWNLGGTPGVVALGGSDIRFSSASVSQDGARLVTTSEGEPPRVWEAATGRVVVSLEASSLAGECGRQRSAAFGDGGRRILASCLPRWDHADPTPKVEIWDADEGRLLVSLPGTVAEVAGDGKRFVVHRDETIEVRKTSDGGLVASWVEPPRSVATSLMSTDGRRLVTASGDGTTRVWDASNGKLLVLLGDEGLWTHPVALNPRATRLLIERHIGGTDRSLVQLVDTDTGERVEDVGGCSEIRIGVFSPDGRKLLTTCMDEGPGRLGRPGARPNLIDVESGQVFATLIGHEGDVRTAAFSPDSERIVTGSSDDTARIWDAATGRVLASLDIDEDVAFVQFGPDGCRVTVWSQDGKVRFWDVALDERTPAEISAVVSQRVPYRLKDGVLVRTKTGAGR